MQEMGPPRTLKEKQRQERESLILQYAEEVLLEKGYHDMSMDEIAARVGIAKGTLYLHFAGKEELALALLERELHDAQSIVKQALLQEGTARSKLEFLQQNVYQNFLGKRGRLLYGLFNTEELRPVLKERHSMTMKQLVLSIATLFEEGKANGIFDTGLPTEIMLSVFFSILSPHTYKHLTVDKQMSTEDIIYCVKRIYFRGIAASPTSPPEPG